MFSFFIFCKYFVFYSYELNNTHDENNNKTKFQILIVAFSCFDVIFNVL